MPRALNNGQEHPEGVVEMLKEPIAASSRPLDEVAGDFVIANRPSSIVRRPASADEVANMVVHAASLQASATTGAALRVDGGVDTIA
jgi:NAD(P)-dependent dehydrogenase (short-subunit alcohol dehydrogenase family)